MSSPPARATGAEPPAILIDDVTKTYATGSLAHLGLKNLIVHPGRTLRTWRGMRRHLALDGVSLSVGRGRCLGVIGRNGSGKSTLLGLVAGVLWPDAGRVRVNGRVCPLLELGAGFHPELTGIENAVMNGVLLGMPRREVIARLDRILEFAELGDFVDRPLRMYSSGMVARLGFSVAVHVDPDVLLMDEVLSVGDERFRQKCTEKLQEFRERGVTMLFVSHSMESVVQVSNEVAWLRNGKVEALGEPEAVVEQYRDGIGVKTDEEGEARARTGAELDAAALRAFEGAAPAPAPEVGADGSEVGADGSEVGAAASEPGADGTERP